MLLVLYILLPVTLTVLASIYPRADYVYAVLLALMLTLAAGLRTEGIDYDQYVLAVDTVRSLGDDDWLLQLGVSKDIFFLFVIKTCSLISDDYFPIFLVMATVSMAAKLLTCSLLPRFKTLFLGLYCILLAPGFELAAIRAAVGIGLLSLSLVYWNNVYSRTLLFFLSISAHLSAAIGVFFASVAAYLNRINTLVLALVVAAFSYGIIGILLATSRGEILADNPGTALSFLLPVYSFIVIYLFVRPYCSAKGIRESIAFRSSYYIAFCCIAFSLGAALPAVTISFRVLEIGQYFLLLNIIFMIGLTQEKVPKIYALVALCALVIMLVSLNVYRETWKAINYLSFELY